MLLPLKNNGNEAWLRNIALLDTNIEAPFLTYTSSLTGFNGTILRSQGLQDHTHDFEISLTKAVLLYRLFLYKGRRKMDTIILPLGELNIHLALKFSYPSPRF